MAVAQPSFKCRKTKAQRRCLKSSIRMSVPFRICLLFTFILGNLLKATSLECPAQQEISETLGCANTDVAASNNGAQCTATDSAAGNPCVDALATGAAEYKTGTATIGSVFTLTLKRRYFINSIQIRQASDLSAQIQEIEIIFNGVGGVPGRNEYINLTKNTATPTLTEKFTFAPRDVISVTLKPLSIYDASPIFGHGYAHISLFHDNCQSGGLCGQVNTRANNISAFFGTYSDRGVSVKMTTVSEMQLVLSSGPSLAHSHYRLTLGANTNTKITLDRVDAAGTVTSLATNDTQFLETGQTNFWLEFQGTAVVLGKGTNTLFRHDDAAQAVEVLYVAFYNNASSAVSLVLCYAAAKCFEDASHFWPLDKLVTTDHVTQTAYRLADGMELKEGPVMGGASRAMALDLTNGAVVLGDFQSSCVTDVELCTNGITVSLWYNIPDPFASGAYIILSTLMQYSSTIAPGYRITVLSTNQLQAKIFDGNTVWSASASVSIATWHHVAIVLHPLDGMTLMIDMFRQYIGTASAGVRDAKTITNVVMGTDNSLTGTPAKAIVSSVVIWERGLSVDEIQQRVICSTFTDSPMNFDVGQLSLRDYSFTASSSFNGTPPHHARLGVQQTADDSGAWGPAEAFVGQYLHLDLMSVVSIYGLTTQGRESTVKPQWVKTYRLSYSTDRQTWKDHTVNGSVTIQANVDTSTLVSIILCEVEARFLRIYPLTWSGWPSMRVAVLVNISGSNEGGAKQGWVDEVKVPSFIGCMKGITVTPVYDVETYKMTPTSCLRSCSLTSSTYAAVSRGQRCFCAMAVTSIGPKERCHEPCTGDQSLKCGGFDYYSVYETKEALTEEFTVTLPASTVVFEKFELTSNRVPFLLDYGDGSQYALNKSSVQFFFSYIGEQSVYLTASTGTYSIVELYTFKESVVSAEVSGLQLECSTVEVALEPFTCFISVTTGSNISLETSLNDEAPVIDAMDSPLTMVAGPSSAPESRSPSDGDVGANRTFLLPGSYFSESGYLKTFAVDGYKPGVVKFQIFRPICKAADEVEYCYVDGNCTNSVPSCSLTSVPPADCPSATTKFSLSSSQCVENTLVCPAVDVPPPTASLTSSYEVVHERVVSVKEGLQVFLAKENTADPDFMVRAGDLLGLGLPAIIGAEISSFTSSIVAKLCPNKTLEKGERFAVGADFFTAAQLPHVTATYVIPSKISLDLNLTSGVYLLKARVFNDASSVQNQTYITVTERVQNVTWVYDRIATFNKTINITVLSHPGYNVSHVAYINNDSAVTLFQERVLENFTFPVTYTSLGNTSVLLIAGNILGYVSELCFIRVFLPVELVRFVDVSPTKLGDTTNITFFVSNGMDVVCNISITDGFFGQLTKDFVNGTELLHTPRTFPAIGEHWTNITCYNPVSSAFSSTLLIVEKVILGLVCGVVHPNRDIEVNETITFTITISQGTNTRTNYSLGYDVISTRNFSAQASYEIWAWYTANITVYNNVSVDNCSVPFQVHKPVFPINITSLDCINANFSTPSNVMMNISSGNDYLCDYNWGDGQVEANASTFWTLGQYVSHNYTSTGFYTLSVECVNRLYTGTRSSICHVFHPITDLQFIVPSGHEVGTQLQGTFNIVRGTNVTYNVSFGNLVNGALGDVVYPTLTFTPGGLGGNFVIDAAYFPDIGVAQATMFAINEISEDRIQSLVYIERPITNYCLTCPKPYVETHSEVEMFASADTGSRVTMFWDFLDGNNLTQELSRDSFALNGHNVTYIYRSNGTFLVEAMASNPLGSFLGKCYMFVQNPVQGVTLTTNSPQIIPTGTIDYLFNVSVGTACPTNATIAMVYGQIDSLVAINMFSTLLHFGDGCNRMVQHSISIPGIYWIQVNLSNAVSSMVLNTTVEVQRLIKGLTATAYHTAGDVGFGARGRGPALDTFPLEYPILIGTSITDGSYVTYSFYFGDGTQNVTTDTSIKKKFSERGTYYIKVRAKNTLNEMWVNFTVTVMEVNIGVQLTNDGPTKWTTQTRLDVSLVQIGYNSCCLVDITNNTYFLFKDSVETACDPVWTNLTSDVTVFSQRRDTNSSWEFQFWQVHYYLSKVTCKNTVSVVRDWKYVIVLAHACKFPKLSIPAISASCKVARVFPKSYKINIASKNSIDCLDSRTTTFAWTLMTSETPDNISSFRYYALPDGTVSDRATMEIPAGALSYGYYHACLNVSLNLWLVDSAICACIKIAPSPLQCFVLGGNGWEYPVNKSTILNGALSYDPDVDPSLFTQNFTLQFYCKTEAENYTFPDDGDDEAVAAGSSGGCFGKGPGRLPSNTTQITIPPGTLETNTTYVFRYYCAKGQSRGHFDVRLHAVETDRPHCAIILIRKTLFRAVLRSSKVVFEAKCLPHDPTDPNLIINWSLYKNENGTWQELNDLAYRAISPVIGPFLVLPPEYLEGGKLYRAKTITTASRGAPGTTYYDFRVHLPPRNGTCGTDTPIQPANQVFSFCSEGWLDMDDTTDVSHSYYYKLSPSSVPTLTVLGSRDECSGGVRLPVGEEALDYNVEVICVLTDKLGGQTRSSFSVKVLPVPGFSIDEFLDKLDNETQVNGMMVTLQMEDSFEKLLAFITWNTDILRKIARDCSADLSNYTSLLRDVELALSAMPTPVPAEEADPFLAQIALLSQLIAKQNERKNRTAIILDRMAAVLPTVQIFSVDATETVSACVTAMLKEQAPLSLKSKAQLAESMDQVLSYLARQVSTTDPARAADAARSTVQAVAYLLHALAISVGNIYSSNVTALQNQTEKEEQIIDSIIFKFELAIDAFFALIVPTEFPLQVNCQVASFTVSKVFVQDLGGFELPLYSCASSFPSNIRDTVLNDTADNSVVSVKGNALGFIAYSGTDSALNLRSWTTTVEVKGIEIANLTEEMEIWVQKLGAINCTSNSLSHGVKRYHFFDISDNYSTINIELRPSVGNITEGLGLTVWLKKDEEPTEEDEFHSLPSNGTEYRGRLTNPYMVLHPSDLSNHTAAGKYWVLLQTNLSNGFDGYSSVPKVNYSLCVYTSDCKFWDAKNRTWVREGCRVGPLTNSTHTHCLCTHLTAFASDFFVPPNKIDWSKITLENLLSNFTVTAILLTTIGLYFLLLIPARRADKRDLKKIGLTPIPSNDPRDTYGYEIVLYTGYQTGQGTTSQVSITLSGSRGETQPRVLKETDPTRIKFKRGSIDSFLLTVPCSLGDIYKLKIWHDHSGDDPSWFLIRVLVRDLQTDKRMWFICNRWLAVEEEDGKIERVLLTASRKEMTGFNMLFQDNARKNLSDGHLWFSCAIRPPTSNFTRVQRMTCCLTLLISTMLASAMFYQTGPAPPSSEVVIGPLRLSVRQLGIAVMSSLVVLPVNLLIIHLFRKAKPKNTALLAINAYRNKHRGNVIEVEDDGDLDKEKGSYLADENVYQEIDEVAEPAIDKPANEIEKESTKKKKKEKKNPYIFPHWVTYIAYVICVLTVLVSSVFVIFYSLTYGKAKSEAWVTAMLISFFQDLLISQPIKVLVMAIIFALIIKNPDNDTEEQPLNPELAADEEWAHHFDDYHSKSWHGGDFVPKPPGEAELYMSRQYRLKQKEMKAIIREITLYLIYLMVLTIVVYGSKDSQAFPITNSVLNRFGNSHYSGGNPLNAVTEPKDYWDWVQNSLVPTLTPQYWYGPYVDHREEKLWTEEVILSKSRRGRVKMATREVGKAPPEKYVSEGLKPFPKGVTGERGVEYIIGTARLRQLRVAQDGCVVIKGVEPHVYTCSAPYSWEQEDTGVYTAGWVPVNSSDVEDVKKREKNSAWIWRSALQLQGTPYWGKFNTYWGGGYIANIGKNRLATVENLQNLELELWIDRYTRAIFAEFALYNAYSNFFVIVNLLSEVTPTGGYFHFENIRTMRIYRYTGPDTYVIMAFELVYIVFLITFTYSEVKQMFHQKKKYLKDPWNYTEIIVICTSFSAIGLYFARLAFGKYTVSRMRDNPDDFISFNYVQVLDDSQNACLAFAVFFAFLKSLKLLRFNRRMGLLTSTVKACAAPLASFFVMFLIVYLAYVQFAFISFGSTDQNYGSFASCMSTMLSMTLGGFDFEGLENNNRLLGPIFFFSYMVFVFTILVNVFIAIINEALEEVSSDAEKQANDYEIIDYMMHKFKEQIGINVGPAIKPLYKPSKTKLEQDVESIESMAENIEYAMCHVIVENQRQMNWLAIETLTPMKKLLLRGFLESDEDFNEDELSDMIPLFEKFLQKQSTGEDMLATRPYSTLKDDSSLSDISLTIEELGEGGYQSAHRSKPKYESLKSYSRMKWFFKRKGKRMSDYVEGGDLSKMSDHVSQGCNMYESIDGRKGAEIGILSSGESSESSSMYSGSFHNLCPDDNCTSAGLLDSGDCIEEPQQASSGMCEAKEEEEEEGQEGEEEIDTEKDTEAELNDETGAIGNTGQQEEKGRVVGEKETETEEDDQVMGIEKGHEEAGTHAENEKEVKGEEAKREEAKREEAKREEAKREEAKREEAKREEAKREEAKREEVETKDEPQGENREEETKV